MTVAIELKPIMMGWVNTMTEHEASAVSHAGPHFSAKEPFGKSGTVLRVSGSCISEHHRKSIGKS